ncbi:MAG: hypothetical protein L6Q46_09715 [Flavobacterium sp.]|uniref:hypothetical protein n=1 Tax=Flavobacterium sp. TaxID=239 RepID=UPI0025BF9B22|nr:hypothetical protein [Flavobacterium sp.]MCK6608557.1 hypothetical protein [Flavobacterium sp.]
MRKHLDFTLKYFSLIISIPPLLGAIWQLIELSKMSLSYIRFFSVSQLVADGILMLIILGFISISVSYLYPTIFKNTNKESDEEENNKSKDEITDIKKPNLILGFVYLILSMFCLFVWAIPITDYLIKKINNPLIQITLATINFVLISGIIVLIFNSIINLQKFLDSHFKVYLKIFFISLITTSTSITFFKYYSEFNRYMLLPNNLINIKKIEYDIKTKYPNTTVTLKYLNDKYIFYSIVDKKKNEKIKIVKFDNLFEE